MAAVFPANQTIVVGGGLAGMSAANQTVECGGRTILLDKSSFCGGNSTKATSGINGAGTKTQAAKGVPDNYDIFFADTMKGGAKAGDRKGPLCKQRSGRGLARREV
jgi:succinate dehydrogenase/fumarate reductase flavoprotein subunit